MYKKGCFWVFVGIIVVIFILNLLISWVDMEMMIVVIVVMIIVGVFLLFNL